MHHGRFLCLEGMDGCGKTTQASLLARWLMDRDLGVVSTREPGGTVVGQEIRKLVLENSNLDPKARFLLFAADRAEHVKIIRRYLEYADFVICDRYLASTLVYQGMDSGISEDFIREVFMETANLFPDVTLWFDLDPVDAYRRAQAREEVNIYDGKPFEYYERIAKRYREFAEMYGWKRIDASGTVEEVHARVLEAVRGHLPPIAF